NNTLTGNSGGNTLLGLDGDDVITGGGDGDLLTGGAGHDQFVYTALTDSGSTKPTRDQITDFVQGDDVIELSALDAITGGADDAFSFIGTAAFSGVAGQLRQSTSFGNTIVSGDVDGNGVGDFQIQINGAYTLNATDFHL
ncbi:MAG TPA: M10 family metallopeptidase C-terminal domain-containing protein, partial [Xanthobacteraceae bacterium]